jgi:hypothetical protein
VFINREEENALMHIDNFHKKYRHAFFQKWNLEIVVTLMLFFFFFFSLSEQMMTEKQQKIN